MGLVNQKTWLFLSFLRAHLGPFLFRHRVVVRVSPQYAQACGGAPSPALLAQNPAAKFLASVPCDAEGRPLVGSKGSGVDIGEAPRPSIGKPR